MLVNYIKIAIRNIFKQKGYSFLNLSGLAIGLASTIIILVWVKYEFSYDDCHENKEQIYSLCQTQIYPSGPLKTFMTPGPLAAKIKDEYPDIDYASRYKQLSKVIRYDEKVFNETVTFVDQDIFHIFTLDMLKGDIKNLFKDYHSVVISNEIAQKYFGDQNPIDKVLKFNDGKKFKVTGVFKDLPKNSSARLKILAPFDHLKDYGYDLERFGYNAYNTWLLLKDKVSKDKFNNKLKGYYQKVTGNDNDVTFWVWPLSKFRLYSVYGGGMIDTIILFLVVAAFILIIACINFMNLSTARSTLRSKEIGLRKVLGAFRKNIINQFLGESVIMTLIAIIFASLIVYIVLPYFNTIAGKEISFNPFETEILVGLLVMIIITSFFAGSYPALFLSSFKPISVLKGSAVKGKSGVIFRRVLVVFQFTLSIGLIIGTIVIQKQLGFIMSKDIGMNKENVVVIDIKNEVNKSYESFKSKLLQVPNIEYVSRVGDLPFDIGSNTSSIAWEGKEESQDTPIGFVDFDNDLDKTMDFKLKYGRFFSKEFRTDSASVVINESMAELMGIENPVGKYLKWGDSHRFHIIGVVNDFNFLPLEHEITPLTMFRFGGRYRSILIKTISDDIKQNIASIETQWTEMFPNYPFEYYYMIDEYKEMYSEETQTNTLFTYFSILAIIISCLGLFGLASYMAEQKTKEIGVRKVLGASVSRIVYIMSKEFIKWVAIANILAWPLAWYFGTNFLDQFVYRTKLSIDIFILSAIASFVIAFITISYQSIKSASGNPVNALRYELT